MFNRRGMKIEEKSSTESLNFRRTRIKKLNLNYSHGTTFQFSTITLFFFSPTMSKYKNLSGNSQFTVKKTYLQHTNKCSRSQEIIRTGCDVYRNFHA